MDELRPKLILTKPGRRGVSRFTFFLILLITFALGVFVGTKIKNINIQVVEKKEASVSNSETRVQGDEKKSYHKEDRLSVATATIEPIKSGEESKKHLKPQELKPLGEFEIYEADKYTIQVAAFEEMGRAQRVANELKEKGYDAYIVSTYNSKGKAWDLIKVGKFKTKEEAQDFASLFQRKESMGAIVEELNGQ
ncbi:MAG: SPOR domain-containing protein [Ignavibacteriales bacterium]